MDRLRIEKILKVTELKDELEFERATSIHGKLRWMVEENSALEPIRQHLSLLIDKYEKAHWKSESEITDTQVRESDEAERIVSAENMFIQRRKELIKARLKKNNISQQDLAAILGHRPNYMSELINGVRPLSRDDIVVIHRLFDIDFGDLIPPFLKKKITNHIKTTIAKLPNSSICLQLNDLEVV